MRRSAKASSVGPNQGTGSLPDPSRRAIATRAASGGRKGSGASSRRFRTSIAVVGLLLIANLAAAASAFADDPSLVVSPTITPSYNTAQVSGTVGTIGATTVFWGFEYTTDPLVEGWNGSPYEGQMSLGTPPTPVSAELHNLKPGHQYQVRLAATPTGFFQPWFSPEPNPTFTTLAVTDPTLTIGVASAVAYTTAHLTGSINPHESPIPISYHFEYSADPGAEGWSSAGSGELSVAEAGGNAPIAVSTDLAGLKTGTAYQFRLVASNGNPFASAEPNPTFTTEAVPPPSVTLNPIATFTASTAHFSGSVNPNAPAGPLSPAEEAAFKTNWHFECTPACPGLAGGSVEADESLQTVSADATGLEPDTSYEVKLVASSAGGTSSDAKTFTTELVLAGVRIGAGNSDGEGGYFLQGAANPRNAQVTACNFEFGTPIGYGQSIPCESSPGTVNKLAFVSAHPTGLTIGATYRFRLTVVTDAGSVSSDPGVFVPTLAPSEEACSNEGLRGENNSLTLPECRAYELVSTGFTGGFGAGPVGALFTENGSLAYQTYAGDVANSGSGGAGNRYVAVRSEAGWNPIADLNGPSKSPLAGPEALFGAGGGTGMYSADLRSSLWYMGAPGESGNAINLYLREPSGHFSLISPYSGPTARPGPPGHVLPTAEGPLIGYLGASSDLSHLVIQGGFLGKGLFEYVGTGLAEPRRVDIDNSGNPISSCGMAPALNGHKFNAVSLDGSVIFFMPAACSGGPAAVEVWARVDGTTSYDPSQSHCTRTAGDPGGLCNAPSDATFEGAAMDGSRVYFTTAQQLVNGDTNASTDLYAYDLPAASDPNPSPALAEVSGGGSEAKVKGVVRISDDGSRVYFVAEGVLAANTDALGEQAVAGQNNLYVWQRDASQPAGRTTFVGRLAAGDSNLWGNETATGRKAQATANGRYLVLSTASPLVATDTDNALDVYRYDADTGETVRVSTDASGKQGNAEGFPATINAVYYAEPWPSHRSRTAITNNGETIVFSTAEALSPADTNHAPDIYLWTAGHLSLASDGQWAGGVAGGELDGSGENLYFSTKEALTANDGDAVSDMYDARVGGGFSFPETATCTGEACQSPPSGPPAAPVPATDRTNGSGNVTPTTKHCPKRKVARNGRCVKKHAKKHHKKSHKAKKHHKKPHKAKRTNASGGGVK